MTRQLQHKICVTGFLALAFISLGYAQKMPQTAAKPDIKWETTFQGVKEAPKRIIQNKQGQFVTVGTTSSWLGLDDTDIGFTIVDSIGTVRPTVTIGGSGNDGANGVVQTRDGGYIIAGFTESADKVKFGKRDAFIVKISETGLWLWELAVGTPNDDEFTDVTEAPNGDVWLTGYSDGNLWVVKVDSRGKLIKTKSLLASVSKESRGSALAWSDDGHSLFIVGQKTLAYGDDKKQLLLTAFDTEGWDFTEKYLESSDGSSTVGNGIVRDDKGNFGIVGTSYKEIGHKKILFCYFQEGQLSTPTLFATKGDNAEGFGIAKDADGQFIIVGTAFKGGKNDTKRKAWLQKISSEGQPLWPEPLWDGAAFEKSFQSVVVSERGFPMAVGSTKSAKKAWILAVNRQEVLDNPRKTDLHILPDRFHDAADSNYLSQGKRGFYGFWLDNRDSNAVFEVVAHVRPKKEKDNALLGEFADIHIGTLQGLKTQYVTVPFSADNTLKRDSCAFTIDFEARRDPLSIKHDFGFRTIDKLKHKLELVAFNFPKVVQAGKTYHFSFNLTNTGELPARNVQILLSRKADTRITFKGDERLKTDDLEVGETRPFEVSFDVDKDFLGRPVLLSIFAKANGESWGNEFRLTSNPTTEPQPIVAAPLPPNAPKMPTRIKWLHPTEGELTVKGRDTFATVFQNPRALLERYDVEAEIESNEPIADANVRLWVNESEYGKDAKFNNVPLDSLPPSAAYAFRKKLKIPMVLTGKTTTIQLRMANSPNVKGAERIRLSKQNRPNLYVLAVGVPYSGLNSLKFTGADALSICAALKTQEGQFFEKVDTLSLTSSIETKASVIKGEIQEISEKMKETDVFILFLSGHGGIKDNGSNAAIFMANNYDGKKGTYLDYETEIEKPLKGMKGQKIVFIDACQSFTNVDESKHSGMSNPLVTEALSRLINADPAYRALLSCSKGELSYEDATAWQHGAFTYALLEAFENKKVKGMGEFDKNEDCQANVAELGEAAPDEFLTFQELTEFIKKRVPYIVKEKKNKIQTPKGIDEEHPEQNIPIFRFNKQ